MAGPQGAPGPCPHLCPPRPPADLARDRCSRLAQSTVARRRGSSPREDSHAVGKSGCFGAWVPALPLMSWASQPLSLFPHL